MAITCHPRGEVYNGGLYGRPTNIWNRLAGGGYVTDGMLETGSNDPVVPVCGGPPAPAAVTSGRSTGQTRSINAGVTGKCTWGAYQRSFEASGNRLYPALSGNARNWANSARATGWTVVDDAQPRSIVVFQPGVQGALANGHVAWVESTSQRSDGRYITLTEMNGAAGFNRWSSCTIKDVPGIARILLP
ncbi:MULTISPECIES: CHAP domain-containing protein [Mycolicibacterium]|uniref:CHAP domain containing protein n=1 Tax=Mycolicibacterium vanbaalenii (strain DSM 7251 / JCM 13017 / BCRC 16820 / KCTC 9966 / NRRL B-24157 / PYR-1) TaxID=350058 RepID=A1THR0_MYCVP|nr:CHAP domain-containing protein [Mycolicibacterium vanbaalenii]ABM16710.1 CHAP domain containing protein [Mycolicibacterium vanbaalenii PYR-1]MCV7130315.1 CHAP domain-containing protein [Mycolicibacterium vanbaalenii PYR-1]